MSRPNDDLSGVITAHVSKGRYPQAAWMLNIYDDQGDVDLYLAFTSSLAARRKAEADAGRKLDWKIETNFQTAQWTEKFGGMKWEDD